MLAAITRYVKRNGRPTYPPATSNRTLARSVITAKRPHLAPIDELVARLREASHFVSLERLAVSPQCGFSNSVMGGAVTPADQERKLSRVVQTARRVWGEDTAKLPDIA